MYRLACVFWLVFFTMGLGSTISLAEEINFTDSQTITASQDVFYEIILPHDHDGWRIALNGTGASDLILRQGSTTGTVVAGKYNSTSHTLLIDSASTSLVPDDTYYIQVHADADLTYSILSEPIYARTLTWDNGQSETGTNVLSNPDTLGGDYLFRITSQTSLAGAWRTVLNVVSGEADLALANGGAPNSTTSGYYSNNTGSDGYIFDDNQFNDNQTWYILVRAEPGAQWNLFSGDLYVHNLGDLAEDGSSSSGTVTIGPEGTVYFQTTIDAATRAWRLFTGGVDLPIYVEQGNAPVATHTSYYDHTEDMQMLLVPPYLTSGLYFMGVSGTPGTQFSLDSRSQQIRTPSTQPGYSGTDEFAFTLTGSDDSGYGYITYEIDVPIDQIAWQVNCTPTSGDPHVYLRQGEVPNRWNNDGLSEATGGITDSIVQVPPSLTNGTWYVTVYGTGTFGFSLSSNNPVITPAAYINDITPIVNNLPNQSGWRYYQTTTEVALGWELELASHVPGTEIAIRRGAVPGRWYYRNNSTSTGSRYHIDDYSTTGLLQRPGHEADIWYVGIYLRDDALGAFELTTRNIPSPIVTLNGGTMQVTAQAPDTLQFFRIDIPDDTSLLGWDLRLTNVTSGMPRMVIRRDELPTGLLNDGGASPVHVMNNWPTGFHWSARNDFTNRSYNSDGTVYEYGRSMTMGLGSALEPGTYYVSITNSASSGPMSYTLQSRGIGIGNGWNLQVEELAFDGGVAVKTGLAPREIAFFKVTVPENSESWSLHLEPTQGEAMVAVRHGRLPNCMAGDYSSADTNRFMGRRNQKSGQEFFYKYQYYNEDQITPGDYYIAVVSEGESPSHTSYVGTGSVNFTLSSLGEVPVNGEPTPPVLQSQGEITWNSQQLDYGEQAVYRFTVPAGTSSVEIQLLNRVGNPVMSIRRDDAGNAHIPYINSSYNAEDQGWSYSHSNDQIITLANPEGEYTLVVAADLSSGAAVDAAYDLVIKDNSEVLLDLNTGSHSVTTQQPDTWKFFRVDVPSDTSLLGWDLRLVNVTSGMPRMVVRRDELPAALITDGGSNPPYRWYYWNTGYHWLATNNFSNRNYNSDGSIYEYGRSITMGIGSPLEPGTYYVGVTNSSDDPMTYTLQSRGIGIGNGWTMQVEELAFTDGVISKTGLAPRDLAFFKVTVPENSSSWSLHLEPTQGEAMMAIRHSRLPNCMANAGDHSITTSTGYYMGRRQQKEGQEFFYKYPPYNADNIASGDYFIAVVSEGVSPSYTSRIGTGTVNFTLSSRGEVDVVGEPSPPVLQSQGEISWNSQQLDYGDQRVYRFTVPSGISSLELRLENRVGNPIMAVRQDTTGNGHFPYVNSYYNADEEGGYADFSDDQLITIANPSGDYTIVVAGNAISASDLPDAGFDLTINDNSEVLLDLNSGSQVITEQTPDTWKFFRVDVPDDASLLGWDLRLVNVTSGTPRMVVRRDELPTSFYTDGGSNQTYRRNYWPTGYHWSASNDFTNRNYSPYTPEGSDYEYGRSMTMGMGSPLEPGTYYIGISNAAASDPMSYTLQSRGIGTGNGWALQVEELAFDGGVVSRTGLEPREIAFYRVTVPENSSSWSLHLEPTQGEVMMAVRHGRLPNSMATRGDSYMTTSISYFMGRRLQKDGQEFFYKYPPNNAETITPGNYYIAVVSEGGSPYSSSYIGTGTVNFTLSSLGEVEVQGEPDPPVLSSQGEISWQNQQLAYGEQRAYRFIVPEGTSSVEIQLQNRVGNPRMTLRHDSVGNGHLPYINSHYNPEDEGWQYDTSAQHIITIPNPAGEYTLIVAADYISYSELPDASFDIVIRENPPKTTLGFENSTVNGQLIDGQIDYYRVVVPETDAWKLSLTESIGTATLNISRDNLPGTSGTQALRSTTTTTILAPPFLTPGIWYIEVKATGLTEYELTSSSVSPERQWTMPAVGESYTQPGLSEPYFGDSGILDDGTPIVNPNTGGQGIDIAEGDVHFYKIVIPEGNGGLVRTKLEAINGDTDIYIRENFPPTRSHRSDGRSGTLYDRNDARNYTLYGNWAVLNGKADHELPPGEWWIGIWAETTNCRYRLILSTGDIQELTMDGGSAVSQSLTAEDMRYYRVEVPQSSLIDSESTPVEWTINLNQQLGDVVVFVRDTVPPGQGTTVTTPSYSSYYQDWYDDNTYRNPVPYVTFDAPGNHTMNVPPVKPGHVYYLGVYANSDAVFDLSSAIGSERLHLDGIPLYDSGAINLTLQPGEEKLYRIFVPDDATRWTQSAIHSGDIRMYISQSTVPPKNYNADWYSNGASDTEFSKYLFESANNNNFPWQPGHFYYLLVGNSGSTAQPFEMTFEGRDRDNDDFDEDGILDWWEWHYFGYLGYSPTGDYDGDGVDNLTEFQDGTDPTDPTDAILTLAVEQTAGGIITEPPAPSQRLPYGTVISPEYTPDTPLQQGSELIWLLGNGQKALLGVNVSFTLVRHTTLQVNIITTGTHIPMEPVFDADVILSGSEAEGETEAQWAVLNRGSLVSDDYQGASGINERGLATDNIFVYEGGYFELGDYLLQNAVKWKHDDTGDFMPGKTVDLAVSPGNYTELRLLNTSYGSGNFQVELTYGDNSIETVSAPIPYWVHNSYQNNIRYNRDGMSTSPVTGVTRVYNNYLNHDVGMFVATIPVDDSKVLTGVSITTDNLYGTGLILASRIYGSATIPGDVNANGHMNLEDAILVLQMLSGKTPIQVYISGDADANGRIGLEEALYILGEMANPPN